MDIQASLQSFSTQPLLTTRTNRFASKSSGATSAPSRYLPESPPC
jgi:hypothetical protein